MALKLFKSILLNNLLEYCYKLLRTKFWKTAEREVTLATFIAKIIITKLIKTQELKE